MLGSWGAILSTALLPLMPLIIGAFELLTPAVIWIADKFRWVADQLAKPEPQCMKIK